MNKLTTKQQKIVLLNFLKGHKKVNELIFREKRKRVTQLSEKNALYEYDNLCKLWEVNFKEGNLGKLEEQKILFLTKRRQLLNRIGGLKSK